MRNMIARPLGLLLSLALLMFLFAQPAAAMKPVKVTILNPFGDSFVEDCDGFQVRMDFHIVLQIKTFYDKDGNAIRIHLHWTINDVLTRLDTGEEIRDNGGYSQFFDIVEGTEAWVGGVWHFTVPGEGPVLLDAGKVVYDSDGVVIFEAGPHEVYKGWVSLCFPWE